MAKAVKSVIIELNKNNKSRNSVSASIPNNPVSNINDL